MKPLQLDDIAALDIAVTEERGGRPLELALDDIDEDSTQPRSEFDADALQELADTIADRGVRQPVSVRPHPQQAGRWMLNFGARRLRASRLAGRTSIAAFVDDAADSYDQVIENEQRERLKPLELALFIQRRMAAGETQAEIARRMGKSRQYVALFAALIDAPDWLMSAYREGRCRGIRELHELRRLHAEQPEAVQAWMEGRDAISRERVQELRETLLQSPRQEPAAHPHSSELRAPMNDAASVPAVRADHPAATRDRRDAATARDGARPAQRKPLLRATLDGDTVVIVTEVAPAESGHVLVWAADESSRRSVAASRLQLLGFGID